MFKFICQYLQNILNLFIYRPETQVGLYAKFHVLFHNMSYVWNVIANVFSSSFWIDLFHLWKQVMFNLVNLFQK